MYGSFKERCWNQIINKTGWVNKKKYKIEAVEILLVLNFPHLSQVVVLKNKQKKNSSVPQKIK